MESFTILFSVNLLAVLTVYPVVADEAVLIQQYDIAELMMTKYLMIVEQHEFTVLYRISATESFGEGRQEDFEAKITLIEVNQERQSLTIKFDDMAQTDIMSLRIPKELISAGGKQLALFIDGKETQYEWSVKEPYNNMIFIVPSHTAEIEIVGTRVIP